MTPDGAGAARGLSGLDASGRPDGDADGAS
jgi:hypothetical protein